MNNLYNTSMKLKYFIILLLFHASTIVYANNDKSQTLTTESASRTLERILRSGKPNQAKKIKTLVEKNILTPYQYGEILKQFIIQRDKFLYHDYVNISFLLYELQQEIIHISVDSMTNGEPTLLQVAILKRNTALIHTFLHYGADPANFDKIDPIKLSIEDKEMFKLLATKFHFLPRYSQNLKSKPWTHFLASFYDDPKDFIDKTEYSNPDKSSTYQLFKNTFMSSQLNDFSILESFFEKEEFSPKDYGNIIKEFITKERFIVIEESKNKEKHELTVDDYKKTNEFTTNDYKKLSWLLKKLKKSHISIDSMTPAEPSLLQSALLKGDYMLVQIFMGFGADPARFEQFDPFVLALSNGDNMLLKALITEHDFFRRYSQNPRSQSSWVSFAIEIGSSIENLQTLMLFEQVYGKEEKEKRKFLTKTIATAVKHENWEAVDFLLSSQLVDDLNFLYVKKTPLIQILIRHNLIKLVTQMLDAKTNPYLQNSKGQTAWDIAEKYNRYSILGILNSTFDPPTKDFKLEHPPSASDPISPNSKSTKHPSSKEDFKLEHSPSASDPKCEDSF